MKLLAPLALLLLLPACAEERPDYDSIRACQDKGHKPGTKEYDKCVSEEKSIRMMDEQRREFEDMKQQQEYYRTRGNRY